MPPLYVASTAVVTFRSSRITGRVLPVSSSALMHSGQVAIAEGRPDEDSQLHLDDGEMPPEDGQPDDLTGFGQQYSLVFDGYAGEYDEAAVF